MQTEKELGIIHANWLRLGELGTLLRISFWTGL